MQATSMPRRRDRLSLKVEELGASRFRKNPCPTKCFKMGFCERLSRPTVNYANVVSNVLKAALTRVYIDAPPWNPPPEAGKILERAARRLGSEQIKAELTKEELEEVLTRFPPRKRELYREGLSTALDMKQHARITVFIKQENVVFKEKDKPRVIQFRSPTFLAHCLPFLKPIEHAHYHGRYLWNKQQKTTCAKGLGPVGRMRLLEQMVSDVQDPYAINLDGSAFDAHVVPNALKAEWRYYTLAGKEAGYSPATIKKMKKMGRAQLINRCTARVDDGTVKYKVDGNRMSGDLNTGLGNSVLQEWYIASAMKHYAVPDRDWRMLVDGDDAVLILSGKHLSKVDDLPAFFARFSQEVKIEGVSSVSLSHMEPIDFCQSRPINVDGKWRLVRDPKKVYNGYNSSSKHMRVIEDCRRYWASVSGPEMIWARGVPVHTAFFGMLHKLSGDARPLEYISNRFWLRHLQRCETMIPNTEIHMGTRESYETAFGITVADQLSIESELGAWGTEHIPDRPVDTSIRMPGFVRTSEAPTSE